MTVQFVSRADIWRRSPGFALPFFALQKAVFDESPNIWESATGGLRPSANCGTRILRVARVVDRTDRYRAHLARSLTRLMLAMNWPELHLLGLDPRAAWVNQRRAAAPTYPPLSRALSALQAVGLKNRFSGALLWAPQDCGVVVPAWFWIARCGAPPSALQLGAPGLNFIGELCQHGNLHLSFYDAKLMEGVDAAMQDCGLAWVDGECRELFSRSGAIAGRTLQLI